MQPSDLTTTERVPTDQVTQAFTTELQYNTSGIGLSDERSVSGNSILQQLLPAYYVYPPALLLLGIVGNTMSFIVFLKIAPGTSISTHFRSLAVTDTIYAATYLIPLWITKTFGVYIREANDFWCKLLTFVNYSAGDVSMWIVVAMAIDRCVGILRPFFAKRFSNSRTALITLVVLIVMSIAKNFSVPIAFGVSTRRRVCTYQSMTYYHANVRYWIALTFAGLLPVLTVFVISCVIGYTLNQHHKQQMRLSELPRSECQTQMRSLKSLGRERTAIILVFANSVTFLVSVMPTFINNALRIFVDRYTLEIMQVFTVFLLYCNHCLGFYVYCLSSAEYRRKVCLVIERTFNIKSAHSAFLSMTDRNSEALAALRKSHARTQSEYALTHMANTDDCTRTPSPEHEYANHHAHTRVVKFAEDTTCCLKNNCTSNNSVKSRETSTLYCGISSDSS